jgi:hypothetical protein
MGKRRGGGLVAAGSAASPPVMETSSSPTDDKQVKREVMPIVLYGMVVGFRAIKMPVRVTF